MKKYFFWIFAAVFSMGLTGCSKYLDKLDNPNLVSDPPLDGLLTQNTLQTGSNSYRMGYNVSYYVQYQASSSQASDIDIYNEVDLSSTWTNFYSAMMNIKQMNDIAAAKGASYHLGVGKIMMAYNLNMLINSFGDVPYSDALKGSDALVPGFDSQEALHDTCLQLLEDGIVELQKTGNIQALGSASDLIHGGSLSAWIKTAYALKARFLNQFSKTASYNPTEILSTLDDAYSSNSDDAALTVFTSRSLWNQVAYNNTVLLLDGWLSTQFVNATNGTNYGVVDPRLPLIATLTKFGDYRGTRNGAGRIGTGTDDEESYLSVNGYYSKGNAPLWLVTYAEMKFIEAEAAFRNGDTERAYDAYIAGITANMTKVGVSGTDMAAYLANPAVGVGASNISLDLIFKEKYVAMFLNPEAWVDARRYDYKYKNFALPQGASLSTFIRRINYPTVEISRNGANVPTITGLDERLVWDQ